MSSINTNMILISAKHLFPFLEFRFKPRPNIFCCFLNFFCEHFVQEEPHIGVGDVTKEGDVKEGEGVGPQALVRDFQTLKIVFTKNGMLRHSLDTLEGEYEFIDFYRALLSQKAPLSLLL